MLSKFTLLGILLLATAALAVPSSPVEAPVARGHEDRQSHPTNLIASRAELASNVNTVVPEQCVSVDWAGACVNIDTVRIILMVHNHIRSQFFFADSHRSHLSLLPSPSQPSLWNMEMRLSPLFG